MSDEQTTDATPEPFKIKQNEPLSGESLAKAYNEGFAAGQRKAAFEAGAKAGYEAGRTNLPPVE